MLAKETSLEEGLLVKPNMYVQTNKGDITSRETRVTEMEASA